jgi:hypothetical protein
MRLSPCRFKVPLTDNVGQPIEARVILDLHRKLLAEYRGFTIHPTSQGRWQSRAGRLYQEEVVVYEIAVPENEISSLREVVCQLGQRLSQLAMYFDAPAPAVEIIDLSGPPHAAAPVGDSDHEPGHDKTARGRRKKNRPSG